MYARLRVSTLGNQLPWDVLLQVLYLLLWFRLVWQVNDTLMENYDKSKFLADPNAAFGRNRTRADVVKVVDL